MMIRQSVFLLMLSIFWVACADYNSSTSDDLEYVEVTANDANDTNFARAFGIIKTRCANCHVHQEWNSFNTNQKWINSPWIEKRDAANSKLINRTKNYSRSGDMPRDDNLPGQEYEDLKTWINNMP